MILFFLLSQISLDPVEFDQYDRMETNHHGHFFYCRRASFHFDVDGSLLKEIKGLVVAMAPYEDGYIYSYYDETSIGSALVTAKGVKKIPRYFARSFISTTQGIYITQKKWVPGNFLRLISITDEVQPMGASFLKIERPDPNLKRIWLTEHNSLKYAVTQLSNVVYIFTKNGDPVTKTERPIQWNSYTGFLRDGKKRREWRRSFDVPVGFGRIKDGWIFAYNKKGGDGTAAMFLNEKFEVVGKVELTGWFGEGEQFTGTDGFRGWVFTPENFSMSVLRR